MGRHDNRHQWPLLPPPAGSGREHFSTSAFCMQSICSRKITVDKTRNISATWICQYESAFPKGCSTLCSSARHRQSGGEHELEELHLNPARIFYQSKLWAVLHLREQWKVKWRTYCWCSFSETSTEVSRHKINFNSPVLSTLKHWRSIQVCYIVLLVSHWILNSVEFLQWLYTVFQSCYYLFYIPVTSFLNLCW